MSKDTFTVVIACTHDADSLSAVLQALSKITYESGFDIMVIDDGGHPGRDKACQSSAKELSIRYVHAPRISRVAAWNFAAQQSSSEFLAYVDDDCIPPADWLEAYRLGFEAWNIGVIGGPDVPPKTTGFMGRSIHYVLTSLTGSLCLRIGGEHAGAYYPRRWNMAARRESVRLSGGFSDAHPECPEVPMIRRMGKLGYRAAYNPDVCVRRSHGPGLWGFLSDSLRLGRRRGLDCCQPGLPMLYSGALALAVAPGLLTLIPRTRHMGEWMLAVCAAAYGIMLMASGVHAVWAARTPLALITVPLITTTHHILHMLGYVAGRLGRLSSGRRAPGAYAEHCA